MTILNSVDIINTISWSDAIWAIIAAICFIIISIAMFSFDTVLSGLLMGISLGFAAIAFFSINQPLGYQYTKIEATIDETVSVIEFLDKYEVLDRLGDIYELKYIDPEKIGEKE